MHTARIQEVSTLGSMGAGYAAVVIAQTQEAWKRGRVTGALLMDVAAAFPSVARGCLLRKMRTMGIDEGLVRWTDSFMRDRRVIMSVDGQDDDPREVTTGLPQGSPISPALFAIYIADIHAVVEGQVQDSRGISFVNDVTWLVEGRDVGEVVQRLERCATASLTWAEGNAVRFEMSKTEAILFSRKRAHKRCQAPVRIGDQTVRFAPEATRWLGIWLDSELRLVENRHRRIAKARQAEARLRRIVSKYGVPPASTRNLQMAIVQGTMLYGAELTWNGRRGATREYQDAISRMGRATLGAFQSTPLGIVTAESGLTPTGALLDHRQAGFTRRLFARPQGEGGPEEILDRRATVHITRLRATATLRRHETAEPQRWSARCRFVGRIVMESKEEAINTARGHRVANTDWADGSRLEQGGGSGFCLEVRGPLGRTPVPSRHEQKDLCHLPGTAIDRGPGNVGSFHHLR